MMTTIIRGEKFYGTQQQSPRGRLGPWHNRYRPTYNYGKRSCNLVIPHRAPKLRICCRGRQVGTPYLCQVRKRSGLALRHKAGVLYDGAMCRYVSDCMLLIAGWSECDILSWRNPSAELVLQSQSGGSPRGGVIRNIHRNVGRDCLHTTSVTSRASIIETCRLRDAVEPSTERKSSRSRDTKVVLARDFGECDNKSRFVVLGTSRHQNPRTFTAFLAFFYRPHHSRHLI